MIKILVIDDNDDVRFTIAEICHFAGWDVIEAASGKEGVEILEKENLDIILVDYHMPNWDGIRTVQEIRKVNTHIPIIALTVDERQEAADYFLEVGATDFSLKPIKAPDLISRIRINLKIAKLEKDQQDVFVDKGINSGTLSIIKAYLKKQNDPLTINEIQQALPFAYQTVHRYLNHMVENGEIEVVAHYGKVGRPKNKYQLMKTKI